MRFAEILPIRFAGGAVRRPPGEEQTVAPTGDDAQTRNRDPLTALPNHLFFFDCLGLLLAEAGRKRRRLGLALLDLEDFRDINEHFGRREGDRLLQETAARLRRNLKAGQILARIGGNEFAILAPAVAGEAEFERFLQSCLEAAGADFRIGDNRVQPRLRIGATVCQLPPPSADAALRIAGLALDRAKQAGGDQLRFQKTDAGEIGTTRYELVESVRGALADKRFMLYFQPQLDVRRDPPIVSGAEALIRMKGNGGKVHRPDEFIPVAETSSLICDIGEWVINEALTQAARWRRSGLDLSLGVNIGARHLLHDNFARRLRAALARQPGVPPATLEIEITESAALADLERAHRVLAECREIGVGVAVDDFGAGHASLTYVQSLPVTRIKVDQRFVRDLPTGPRNMAVITGTIASSQLLGIDVVAEGVETVLHGATLVRLGCGLLQGYCLTPPLPDADFRAWLRRWQAPAAWRQWSGGRTNAAILPLLIAEIAHRRDAAMLLDEGRMATAVALPECPLTLWLGGAEPRAASHPEAMRRLRETHVRFHRAAAMLQSARSGARPTRLKAERESLAGVAKELIAELVGLQEALCPRPSQTR